jgi:UDP-glucose 4-epimerase
VTGGAGFIGSNLVEYHLGKGDKVHVVDDLSTGMRENLDQFRDNPDFRFDEADVLTWPGLDKATAWADRIYHMAAVVGVFRVLEQPIKVLATNVAGCERVLRAAQSGNWSPQIVIASTSEVYGSGVYCGRGSGCPGMNGHSIPAFDEDMEPMVGSSAVSRWNYSISKLVDEAFGLSYARVHGMKVTVIRFFNTVGPRQTGRYGMVLPRFVGQAIKNEPITVFGNGTQTRCFCDVRDTVAALDLVASNSASAGQIVNVGSDREISIRDLAELVKSRTSSKSQLQFMPQKEAYGEDFQETIRRRPNLDRFYRLTGFKYAWTLEQTIDDLVARERSSANR